MGQALRRPATSQLVDQPSLIQYSTTGAPAAEEVVESQGQRLSMVFRTGNDSPTESLDSSPCYNRFSLTRKPRSDLPDTLQEWDTAAAFQTGQLHGTGFHQLLPGGSQTACLLQL